MGGPVLAALIAAITALFTSIASLVAQWRTATLQNELTVRRDEVQRVVELQRIMSRYRQPLLQAATDLQSRLYNVVRGRFLQIYGRGSGEEQQYTVENSLFVFGEYFGWVEALRRDIQFLDVGEEEGNRKLQACIERVASEFLRDDLESEFRLFRGQQRAIGEVMLTSRSGGDGLECIGMATFAKKMVDPEFGRWFGKLQSDLQKLTERPEVLSRRTEHIQGTLIDLMDCLDPKGVRIPASRRQKLATDA